MTRKYTTARSRPCTRNGKRLTVTVEAYDGDTLELAFEHVEQVAEVSPVGMIVYSLSEMSTDSAARHFVFVNTYEADESDKRLEVLGPRPQLSPR